MKRLNMHFTDKQANDLKSLSDENEIPQAELIRRAWEMYYAFLEQTASSIPLPNQKDDIMQKVVAQVNSLDRPEE